LPVRCANGIAITVTAIPPFDLEQRKHPRAGGTAGMCHEGKVPNAESIDPAAMKDSALTWNDETLDRYLADPKSFVRGNRMPYSLLMGPTSAERRAGVVTYLHTLE
jgi:hypothetical protein